MIRKLSHRLRGFTLIEIMMAIAIISILATIVYGSIGNALEKARFARAKAELSEIAKAAEQMALNNGGIWPPDASRSLPSGIETYLGPGTWPDAPWDGSVFDWDNFETDLGEQTYQISIRFCPLGLPDQCKFPDEPWAKDFDYYSSVYYCIYGHCRAHINMPADHPGLCVNCGDNVQ